MASPFDESHFDEITDSLNQSGVFLQTYILNQFDENWETFPQYQIRLSQGIMESPKTDKQVESSSKLRQTLHAALDRIIEKKTSMDILAKKSRANWSSTLCIECKKSNSQSEDWIFFKQSKEDYSAGFFFWSNDYDDLKGKPTLFCTSEIDEMVKTRLWFKEMDMTTEYKTCDFALSLKKDTAGDKYGKSSSAEINRSTKRVIEATYGHIINEVLHKIPDLVKRINPHFFIPIVVTNASLYTCEYNPKQFDMKDGLVKEHPKYTKTEGVFYDCPIPNTVWYPNTAEYSASRMNFEMQRFRVLVLNPNGFLKFLEGLNRMPSHL